MCRNCDIVSSSDEFQGGEKYQQAFYVFEELAQAPSTSSIWSLVSQAVCELQLGRLEESQAALEQAIQKDPQYVEAIANLLVLTVISGKDPKELTRYVCINSILRVTRRWREANQCHHSTLKRVKPNHPLLVDLEEKSALFDKAATKYSARVSG